MKTMMSAYPHWAILIPADAVRVEELANELMIDGGYDVEVDDGLKTWSVTAGVRVHTAIIEYEGGDEGCAMDVAKALARRVDADVYLLLLTPDGASSWIVPIRGRARRVDEDPHDLAARLGCALPAPRAVGVERREAIVVEGAEPGVVADVLEETIPEGMLTIRQNRLGTLVHSQSGRDLGLQMGLRLSAAIPGRRVLTVGRGPFDIELSVIIDRDGATVGMYMLPRPDVPLDDVDDEDEQPCPYLLDVDGETRPERILEALDVPPGLLSVAED